MAEMLADNLNRVSNLELLKELQGGEVQTVAPAQTPHKICTEEGESARGLLATQQDTDNKDSLKSPFKLTRCLGEPITFLPNPDDEDSPKLPFALSRYLREPITFSPDTDDDDEDSLKSPFKLTRCLGPPITFLPDTDDSSDKNEVASDTIYAHVEISSIAEKELVAVASGSEDKPTTLASDTDFKILNEFYAHPKFCFTMPSSSNPDKTMTITYYENETVVPAAEMTKAEPSKEPKHAVSDRLLDSYPDRNPGETCFPHLAPSVSSPDLDSFYKAVRDRILVAIQDENFRGGHFKFKFASNHGSIQAIILEMQLSGEVSKKQYAILQDFGRVWSAAIGVTNNYVVLDDTFLVDTGLAAHASQLFAMFDEEKRNPNLYPLPDSMKYKDPVTRRKELEEIVAKHKAEKAAAAAACHKAVVPFDAGISSTAGYSGDSSTSFSKDNAFASSSSTNIYGCISKAHLLAKLSEYKASESNDTVMRNAWNEIYNHKGDITAKAIDEMSDETMKLIYDMIQSEAQALNIPMPMGAAINATLAKLDAMELNGPPSKKASSDLYSPHKQETKKASKVSKLKKKLAQKKEDSKGKENA